jgi:hypothetical protein
MLENNSELLFQLVASVFFCNTVPLLVAVFWIRIWLDPHSISAWIRDLDLHLESRSGFGIWLSENRYKKPKFTMSNICIPLTSRTGKCSDWAEIFNYSSLALLQELFTHDSFFLALLKSYHIECKLILLTFLTVRCSKISLKIIFSLA